MSKHIANMENHYILTGFGRVGRQIATELAQSEEPFVIVEKNSDALEMAKDNHWPHIMGDAAVEESLFEQAAIGKAKGVIIAVGTDADAIFMAVSARALNPDVFIVARASSRETAGKLEKVGVNRVALPYQIGGYHMATLALRPSVVDFLDVLIDGNHDELEMEEFAVEDTSHLIGKPLSQTPATKRGLAVVAIRRKAGKTLVNPAHTTEIKAGDILIVLGPRDKLDEIEKELSKRGIDAEEAVSVGAEIKPKIDEAKA